MEVETKQLKNYTTAALQCTSTLLEYHHLKLRYTSLYLWPPKIKQCLIGVSNFYE